MKNLFIVWGLAIIVAVCSMIYINYVINLSVHQQVEERQLQSYAL